MLSNRESQQGKVYANATPFSQFKPAVIQLDSAAKVETAPSSIYIVATGGTIAGAATSSVSATYEAGKLSVEQLTAAIPGLDNFDEDIHTLNLYHIDSSDVTISHWLQLAKKINELLKNDDIKGVVITHGTDTMEETAYFLDLVVKSDKPVVLVGSMRAATSLSPDGPLNLFNAISLIHSDEAKGRGVMVLMNDTIFDGRDVTKCNTSQTNTFSAPNSGPIGHVNYGEVEFHKNATRKHTHETTFDVDALSDLPNVEIVYEYAGSRGNVLKAVIAQKPEGIIIAGTGCGNVTAADKALLRYAREAGIQIIRSSRTGSGKVTYNNVDGLDAEIGLIAGDNLNPQKARILLMLSLTQTKVVEEIRKNFATY